MSDSFVKVASIGSDGSVQLQGGAPAFGLKLGSRYMMTNAKSLVRKTYNMCTAMHVLHPRMLMQGTFYTCMVNEIWRTTVA
jgi:hypothetical protein